MTNGTPLDHVIARNLREILDERGVHHRVLAAWMHALGFDWTTNRVAQTVTLRRSLGVAELAGLCNVLAVPLERLLAGGDNEQIALSTTPPNPDKPITTAPLAAIRTVLATGRPDPAPEIGRGWGADLSVVAPYVPDELEDEVARKLGTDTQTVRGLSHRLYGNTHVTVERERRTGDVSDLPTRTARAKRGHAMRGILSEMRALLNEWEAKRKEQANG